MHHRSQEKRVGESVAMCLRMMQRWGWRKRESGKWNAEGGDTRIASERLERVVDGGGGGGDDAGSVCGTRVRRIEDGVRRAFVPPVPRVGEGLAVIRTSAEDSISGANISFHLPSQVILFFCFSSV